MKTIILAFALALGAVSVRAGTIIVAGNNFNDLGSSALGKTFTSNGITFSSPTDISVVTGYLSGEVFGWTGAPSRDPGILVRNDSWLTIVAGGELMSDVHFTYGFDWNGFEIDAGLIVPYLNWQAWTGANLVGSGMGLHLSQHGGAFYDVNIPDGFDRLLLSSTALVYQGILGPGGSYTRGPVTDSGGIGTANRIALDNVVVTYDPPDAVAAPASLPWTAVYDSGSSAALLAFALTGLIAVKRRIT